MYQLIIFDADGTLCNRDTGELLPGVREWNEENLAGKATGHFTCVAIATNQGGPACGEQPWAKPGQFPTLAEVEARYEKMAQTMEANLYMSLAYVTKRGGTLLPSGIRPDDPRARLDWRKPSPGMLLAAMADYGAETEDTLVVGDSSADVAAARAAGCDFMYADTFFEREEAVDA